MRILLVEDDFMLGDGVQSGLKQVGYTVNWVTDGEAALTTLGNEKFDAILMDLGLPKRPGLEVLQELRQRGHTEPVLIFTARDSLADRTNSLAYGANDFLNKPFDLHVLYTRLAALIQTAASGAVNKPFATQ